MAISLFNQKFRYTHILYKVLLLIISFVLGSGFFLHNTNPSFAQIAINGDCYLVVPPNPLSAQGLATPYQLYGVDAANMGPCHEADRFQSTFVQAAILDPATGQISIYNPLVVDYGTQPIIPPIVPALPANAVVAIWGGTNANTITLKSTQGSLTAGKCINGINGSIFGQNWNCNAKNFFIAAKQAIKNGTLVMLQPGTALDGLRCPTVDDFAIVDQDPHDNVTTQYLALINNGAMAQFNNANLGVLSTAQIAFNGSDERSITTLQQALGCNPAKAPDLSNPSLTATSLPLNELQAYSYPATPSGLVGAGDPFTFDNNGNPNLQKLNLFREMVGEPLAKSLKDPSVSLANFCTNLYKVTPTRMILLDKQFTEPRTSPDPYVATNLFSFLAQRYVAAYEQILQCNTVINKPDPIKLTMDINGVTTNATLSATYMKAITGNNGNNNNKNNNKNAPCVTGVTDKALNVRSFNPNQLATITCTPTQTTNTNNGNGNSGNRNFFQRCVDAIKNITQYIFNRR